MAIRREYILDYRLNKINSSGSIEINISPNDIEQYFNDSWTRLNDPSSGSRSIKIGDSSRSMSCANRKRKSEMQKGSGLAGKGTKEHRGNIDSTPRCFFLRDGERWRACAPWIKYSFFVGFVRRSVARQRALGAIVKPHYVPIFQRIGRQPERERERGGKKEGRRGGEKCQLVNRRSG